jgi:RimJ/RimL family protein N-acetyltransferase
MTEFFKELETPRLRLRAPVLDDAEAIFEEYATDADVTRYLTWAPHPDVDSVREFLEGTLERIRTGDEYSWVITLADANRPVGMIAARNGGHMADLGYVLGRNYWNRGIMTEAVVALSEWILSRPGFYRVWAVCDTKNVGSARVLEKSQFEREGMLRRWMVKAATSPEPSDCFVYGRIR